MKSAVISFPGTNCDHDLLVAIRDFFGVPPRLVYSRERELPNGLDVVFLPGGFSYGDYLRPGAMAKVSPIVGAVRGFAARGGTVVGICNGFQILCEMNLLPGVLLPNRSRKFLSRPVYVRVESSDFSVTKDIKRGAVIQMPVAHFEGNYFADRKTVEQLEGQGRVVFRYCAPDGEVFPESPEWNPNGSINAIAGIANENGNVIGFMPHPERLPTDRADNKQVRAIFLGLG